MHDPTRRRWTAVILDRLTELVIVFIGVYAAFILSAHQSHEQERQRRGQILALLEKGAAATAASLKQTTVAYDQRMNEFLTRLSKGEMPEVTAISWATSYNPEERNWLLQAGLELLDIETIVRLKELDAWHARVLAQWPIISRSVTSSSFRTRAKGPPFSTTPRPSSSATNMPSIRRC